MSVFKGSVRQCRNRSLVLKLTVCIWSDALPFSMDRVFRSIVGHENLFKAAATLTSSADDEKPFS